MRPNEQKPRPSINYNMITSTPQVPIQELPTTNTPVMNFSDRDMEVTACTYVNVREEASINSKILKQLPCGAKVKVIELVDESWFAVELEDGITGYILFNYLAI